MSDPIDLLVTEFRNPVSFSLHELSVPEILSLMNKEDRLVPFAVEKEIQVIAKSVEIIVDRLKDGGRLFYIGAGTSGRLGILDASEAPPTFGVEPALIQGIIAGGEKAVFESIEGAEDNEEEGGKALIERSLSKKDVVIGISASGKTPFVIGGLKYAKKIGAPTIGLTSNPEPLLCNHADTCIKIIVGPEIITGSTRMKAGTAQKLVLNMISTASMIRLGKVYSNLMIDLVPKSKKLVERAQRILMQLTGCTEEDALIFITQTNGNIRKAVELFNESNTIKENNKKTT